MIPWIWAWIAIQMLLPHPVGTNPMSRMATMAALCSEGRFEISSYVKENSRFDWTVDWAKTPDGRYFSNKAPGAALLGAPIFCLVDRLFYSKGGRDTETRIQMQYRERWVVIWICSLLLQLLPMGTLVLLSDRNLSARGLSLRARQWAALALLFGHTGAIYMNSWWGHGLSVVLGLATLIALQSKKFLAFGFALGLALLNDYSMALTIPGFAVLFWSEKPNLKEWVRFIVGGIFPGVLWILYHVTSFGSPFTLPNAFQNPQFVDHAAISNGIGGLFAWFPDPMVVWKLLFGTERGLIFTHPWILIALGLFVFRRFRAQHARSVNFFLMSCFVLFFWMNASFNGWDGGNTVGPRYLSPVLPFFALWLAPVFDRLSLRLQRLLEIGLLASIILFVVSYAISIEPPIAPLWTGFHRAAAGKDGLTLISRLVIQCLLLGGAWGWQKRSKARMYEVRGNAA